MSVAYDCATGELHAHLDERAIKSSDRALFEPHNLQPAQPQELFAIVLREGNKQILQRIQTGTTVADLRTLLAMLSRVDPVLVKQSE